MKTFALVVFLVWALVCLNACGGGYSSPSTPAPTVTISASPGDITLGDSATLTWSSANATSCMATATPSEGDWAGAASTAGSQAVTPAGEGTTTYSLQCTGSGGQQSASAAVKTTIGVLAIGSPAPPVGVVGKRYNLRFTPCRRGMPGCTCHGIFCLHPVSGFNLLASGGVAPFSWNWAPADGSSLPPGLNLSSSLIDGMPSTAGAYNVTVTVVDSQTTPATATASYTLTVNNPPPPAINADIAPSAGALNLPYSFTFTASGLAPLTWAENGSLPPGLALAADGTLSGTPTALGSYPIHVTATDAVGQPSTPGDVTIEVFPHGFKVTGSMGGAREGHTATLLANGKVLVTGGIGDTTLSSAELFDPTTETFASTGNMTIPRTGHSATLLTNGKVLIAGGNNDNGPNTAAELYDPASGTFASTGSMTAARTGHTATLLSNGKVLITGGFSAAAELFDPGTGTFTATGSMAAEHSSESATLLPNGKVLVSGGANLNGEVIAVAELFDPATGTFTASGSMATPRRGHTATLLPNGKVLISGGTDSTGTLVTAGEVFDPAAGSFASTGNMGFGRQAHASVLLQDGTVLITGGSGLSGQALAAAELYVPSGGNFNATGSLTTGRYFHTITLLNDGRVLVTGGVNNTGVAIAGAELYQ